MIGMAAGFRAESALPPAETMDTMVFVYPDKTIVMNQHIRAALRKAPEVFPLFRRSRK